MDTFIATPSTRAFEYPFVASLLGDDLSGCYWSVIEGQALGIARNLLVKRFLASSYKYLLFVDSDATWAPGTIKRLIGRMNTNDLPFLCAGFFKRDIYPTPTIGMRRGSTDDGFALYDFAPTIRAIVTHPAFHDCLPEDDTLILDPTPLDLVKIEGCGMHFTAIRRDAVEAITDAKSPWFDSKDPTAGEDFAFCQKILARGYKMFFDRSLYVGHILGPGLVTGVREFLRAYELGAFNTEQIWKIP